MGVVQCTGHFLRKTQCVIDGKLFFPGKAGAQRLAGDERHDIVEKTVGHPGVDQSEDVWMLEVGGDLDLG